MQAYQYVVYNYNEDREENESIATSGIILARSLEDAKLRVVLSTDNFDPDTQEVVVRPF